MIRSKVAFHHASDLRILVTLEVLGRPPADTFSVTAFDDENELLQQIVLAELTEAETIDLVSKVILTVAGRPYDDPWVQIHATAEQLAIIGLQLPFAAQAAACPEAPEPSNFLQCRFLRSALEQTPTPLCLLEGPDHTFTFINDGYVRIAGRHHQSQLLGKPVRVGLHDLEGQPFFNWLDQVYATGEPHVGHEVPGRVYSYRAGRFEDLFFDFVFQPVRGRDGKVSAILCQATDVTDCVLDRHVRDTREEQLFRQWAELDALYRTSPLGMSLVRASDLTIQRVNEQAAQLSGRRPEDLIGRRLEDLYPEHHFVLSVMRRVIQEKTPRSLEINSEVTGSLGHSRRTHWSLQPIFNAAGEVESIASTIFELSQAEDVDAYLGSMGEFAGAEAW